MVAHQSRPRGRSTLLWMALSVVVVLSFALAACGGGSSTPASSTQSNSSQPTASSATAAVTITEKLGTHDIYSFAPQTLTIKAGQAVMFTNQSDEFHLLMTADATGTPTTDAAPFTATSIVPTSRASATTTLQVVFTTPGTYYYTSKLVNRLQDGNHPEGAWSQGWGTIVVTA
jgi:plastocyanin